jgi:photosystem I P700 chlorophyll a apoprotein A2
VLQCTSIADIYFQRIVGFHGHISHGVCATNKYFQIIGSIHDLESNFGGVVFLDNTSSFNLCLFMCHWGHLAIIFVWVSRNLFHIGWNGNYSVWVKNPISCGPIAHGIWDPHFSRIDDITYLSCYSGIYNWVYTVGF